MFLNKEGLEQKEGTILRGIGGFYTVLLDDGTSLECRARGKFRKEDKSPLPGDRCVALPLGGGEGAVGEILPRKNRLVRPPVANVDRLVVVCSAAPPVTDLFLMDKVLVIAAHEGIGAVLAVNKSDACPGRDLYGLYERAGYPVYYVSAATGCGAEELRTALSGGFTVLTGNSGVGKSSLLNRLFPELSLETSAISEKIGRGRHTTRQVTLFPLGGGAFVADTPGFSSFDLDQMEQIRKEELEDDFPEFRPYLGACRFQGCAHGTEKGCAVLAAAERGEIAASRLASYHKLYENARKIKEWERK